MVHSAWSAVLGDGRYMVLDGQHMVHSGWSVHGALYMVVDNLRIWFVRRHDGCICDSVSGMGWFCSLYVWLSNSYICGSSTHENILNPMHSMHVAVLCGTQW